MSFTAMYVEYLKEVKSLSFRRDVFNLHCFFVAYVPEKY